MAGRSESPILAPIGRSSLDLEGIRQVGRPELRGVPSGSDIAAQSSNFGESSMSQLGAGVTMHDNMAGEGQVRSWGSGDDPRQRFMRSETMRAEYGDDQGRDDNSLSGRSSDSEGLNAQDIKSTKSSNTTCSPIEGDTGDSISATSRRDSISRLDVQSYNPSLSSSNHELGVVRNNERVGRGIRTCKTSISSNSESGYEISRRWSWDGVSKEGVGDPTYGDLAKRRADFEAFLSSAMHAEGYDVVSNWNNMRGNLVEGASAEQGDMGRDKGFGEQYSDLESASGDGQSSIYKRT